MRHKNIFWIIFLVCCLSGVMFADVMPGEREFELSWQEDGLSYNVHAREYRGKFDKEPNSVGGDVIRFKLELSDKKVLYLLWDKDNAAVYADLDCDGDLTNDPNGFFKADADSVRDSESYSRHMFGGKEIRLKNRVGTERYKVDFEFYKYGDRFKQARIYIHSGYTGRIELDGKSWQTAMIDTLTSDESESSLKLGIANYGEDNGFNFREWLTLKDEIFLGGKNYKLSYELVKKDQSSSMVVRLKEEPVEMGRLKIVGDHISTLVFVQGNRYILPDVSNVDVNVPGGELICELLQLKLDDGRVVIAEWDDDITVDCNSNEVVEFKAGMPLNHSVAVTRLGGTLKLDYRLLGQAGEEYSVREVSLNGNKPSFVVYKGDMQVGSGSFEYG